MINIDPVFYKKIYLDNIERMTILNVMKQLKNGNGVKEPISIYENEDGIVFIDFNVFDQLLIIDINKDNNRSGFTINGFNDDLDDDFEKIFMKHFNCSYGECIDDLEIFLCINLDKKADFFNDIINMLYDDEISDIQ